MQVKKLQNTLKASEDQLYGKINKKLNRLGYTVQHCNDKNHSYLYAEGEIPVLLVAHIDTVHVREPEEIYFDPRHGVMWSPTGLGADDRAGVFAILEIVEDFKCGVLICSGEESGGLGAKAFVSDFPYNPKYRMAIELDRCDDMDCVFYDNDSHEFKGYIQGFGFKTAWGSFSDISVIGPAWKVNSVNLSVGFENEHTSGEHLFLNSLFSTIDKVRNILSTEIPVFEYRERIQYYRTKSYSGGVIGMDEHDWNQGYGKYSDWCDGCGKYTPLADLREVELSEFLVCSSCLDRDCFVCESCNEIMINSYHKTKGVCDDCWDVIMLEQGGKKPIEKRNGLTVIKNNDKIGENRS